MSVTIVLPPISDDQISHDLRWLTQALVENKHTEDPAGGGLGGEFGYGVHFENDVFEMHPFYWGDCVCGNDEAEAEWSHTHDHASSCYQSIIRARGFLDYDTAPEVPYAQREAINSKVVAETCAEMGLDAEYGTYVHCTCSHDADYAAWVQANPHAPTCGIERPNFRHKPSGSTVCWYKWIGRSMEVDVRVPWADIVRDCVASLSV